MRILQALDFRPDFRNGTKAATLSRISHERGLSVVNRLIVGPNFTEGSLNLWLSKLEESAHVIRNFLNFHGEVTRSMAADTQEAATYLTSVGARVGHLLSSSQRNTVDGYAGLAVRGQIIASLKGRLVQDKIIMDLAELAAESNILGWGKKDALELLQSAVPTFLVGPVAVKWASQLGPHTQIAREI